MEIHSNTHLPQDTRETSNNNLTLYLKHLEKEEKKNPKVSRRKEITKIRPEISGKSENQQNQKLVLQEDK